MIGVAVIGSLIVIVIIIVIITRVCKLGRSAAASAPVSDGAELPNQANPVGYESLSMSQKPEPQLPHGYGDIPAKQVQVTTPIPPVYENMATNDYEQI